MLLQYLGFKGFSQKITQAIKTEKIVSAITTAGKYHKLYIIIRMI